ncbi:MULTISPECIES: adenosylcobinamide amidohydrolase [Haloferax]|uniref:Adenosylcobinamide amidohydrolase n=2 Tax=Haloferax TaxID=2251 RepID=A0A6G1YYE5_9EURY|nr:MULTISPECIES: adenosylcobinamide amidohydrolase [Haloferax]KAB1186637.1 adenosylcobinamide amidohydrolase [Haloferax sp. CBA1149]MRW79255.1 adenosylcobinamide amidohydrolase [Haloferax marinisediminis]
MFEVTRRDGVCRLYRPETRWLSTGYAGGESHGSVAYNVSVPKGWPETDLDTYIERRRAAAGFDEAGPTLLTGVDQAHARRAQFGPVEAVVTAGVSNPAALPTEFEGGDTATDCDGSLEQTGGPSSPAGGEDEHVGTVNVVVGTTRSLEPGALANLVAVAAEAKAATLLSRCGSPGTTTDAVIAACDPAGEPEAFSGSATTVGHASRVCVRDAVLASLDSRYATTPIPRGVEAAQFGVVADERATVSQVQIH